MGDLIFSSLSLCTLSPLSRYLSCFFVVVAKIEKEIWGGLSCRPYIPCTTALCAAAVSVHLSRRVHGVSRHHPSSACLVLLLFSICAISSRVFCCCDRFVRVYVCVQLDQKPEEGRCGRVRGGRGHPRPGQSPIRNGHFVWRNLKSDVLVGEVQPTNAPMPISSKVQQGAHQEHRSHT